MEELTEQPLHGPLPRGRHKLPREFVRRSQRERLLRAMAEQVAAKGYAATSVAHVIERAGVSRKTFYEQFDDKEACFLAAYDGGVTMLVDAVLGAYERGESWPERVANGLGALLDLFVAEPALAQMCTVEVLAAGPRAIERYREVVAGFFPFFGPEARGPGTRDAPDVVGEAVVLGIHGVIYRRILAGELQRLPELFPDLLRVALSPYLELDEIEDVVANAAERRKG